MIDAEKYLESIRLPAGATDESTLKISVAALKDSLRHAYLSGAVDATDDLRGHTPDLPDFFGGIFGKNS